MAPRSRPHPSDDRDVVREGLHAEKVAAETTDASARAATVAAALATALLVGLAGCQTAPPRQPVAPAREAGTADLIPGGMHEKPAPPGAWRPHWLARCDDPDELPPILETCLAEAADLLAHREGSDAIAELEICREESGAYGLLDLALGQLYLIAGRGEPDLLPREGPAADVGDWPRNQVRLLDRAELLLRSAERLRPDDGAVDFLLADVARARGRYALADSMVWGGLGKCSRRRSVALLRRYQDLNRYPAKLVGSVSPEYPESALRGEIQGRVVVDILIDPAGQPVQAVAVQSPAASLTKATVEALQKAEFEPARIGKFPLWAWLEITVDFALE